MNSVKGSNEHFGAALSSIEEVIEEAKAGRIFILVDDENRENEGDLCIPAENATPDHQFYGKVRQRSNLSCDARSRIEQLGLPLMSRNNATRLETAFTVSIEARGCNNCISAHDRAKTISVAVDPKKSRDDIVSPGHVFPLVAKMEVL